MALPQPVVRERPPYLVGHDKITKKLHCFFNVVQLASSIITLCHDLLSQGRLARVALGLK